ncbi:DUF3140 domain-containing protein [Streptomyces sp. 6N223]|uniref:DUF3140 domain-containing protein n=1 Tax=Streptomyces sp. 6N223 TaxID=3457412 RepID=UPI003FD4AC34
MSGFHDERPFDELEPLELDVVSSEFRSVVNMTSQELAAWLRTAGGAETESPEVKQGRGVLSLLHKRPMDLNESDLRLMREVVDTVQTERSAGPRPSLPEPDWRYRLMSLGHDPLRG